LHLQIFKGLLTNTTILKRKFLILFSIIIITPISCFDNLRITQVNDSVAIDLNEIKLRGKLIAITDFNSTNYFIYRGEPMGFHYELLKAFSDHLGIDLEIITENHLKRAFGMLKSGKADILAIGLTVNESRKKEIQFTEPVDVTRQVLVQRKPHNWREMTLESLDKSLIRNQLDLAQKTVYVQEGSSHIERLHNLAGEIGDSIAIIEVPYDAEKLIKLVANGEIDYTVSDEYVAQVIATYYPGIDVGTPVSFPQNIAWGLRKENSEMLMQELNGWLRSFKKTPTFALLYAKYFKNSRTSIIVKSDYYVLNTGKVSPWDDMIKSYSDSISWDWRLLASLIYQESRFKANVVSWAGAYGLMQVMPATGANLGIDITTSPRNNIKAGTKYINWLHSIFDERIPDENERLKFILASYNAGPGHVLDAMKLAEKNGMDPQKWDGNVTVWLLKKSEPRYYNDIDVKSGYFRGTESVAYVDEVLERYERYKNIIPVSEN